MRFLSILKTVLKIAGEAAPVVIERWSPTLAGIVSASLSAIVQSEAIVGPGQGDKKRDMAMMAMQVALPVILQSIEHQTGKQLTDDALFAAGVTEVQEGLVKMLNSFGALPKAKA